MGFMDDDVLTLSGALTFSTLLSFAPVVVITLSITASLGVDAQQAMQSEVAKLAGNDAAATVKAVIASAASRPAMGSFAGLGGLLVAIVGGTTAFAQLQASLNDIWKIDTPSAGAIGTWIKRRLLSVGLLFTVAFILCTSLVISALLGIFLAEGGIVWEVLNELIGFIVFAALFAAMFRYLPDTRLPAVEVMGGGAVTAFLFIFGKTVIGLYLAHGDVGGAYGAAGSLVVLLVWIYYSSAIFFFGAELIKAYHAFNDVNKQLLARVEN